MTVSFLGDATSYPTITVEFGFSGALSGFGAFDEGVFDTATFGPDISWTDVSSYVRGVQTSWQRSRQLDRQPSANLTLTLSNATGRFTPGYLSGPYVVAGRTQILPRVPVRVRATYGGTTYPVFRGFVTSWRDSFPGVATDCVTTVQAVDVLSSLAAVDIATATSAGSGDTVPARFNRILNAAGVDVATAFDVGVSTMQATTMGANALALLQLTADSDGGLLFANYDGTLTYYDRNSTSQRAKSVTSQATFSTSGIGFSDPQVDYDDQGLVNVARYTRVGGSQQTSRNAESEALYGIHTDDRTDLVCTLDADVMAIARKVVGVASVPEYRVASITVSPARTPANWATVLGLGIRDRCSVTVPAPFGTITQDVYVSGISHSIQLNDGWRVTFGWESATRYVGTGLFDISVFDTGTFWL